MKKKLAIWIAAIILAIFSLSFIFIIALPSITKLTLNDWLEEQGLSDQIDNIDINLFTGEVRLTSLKPEVSQKQNLAIGNLQAKIHLRDLWRKKITIESISLSDFYIDIKQTPSGIYSIGDIKTGNNDQVPNRKLSNSTGSSPWTFSIDKLELNNIKTCYSSPVNSPQNTHDVCLMLEGFKLNKASGYLIERINQNGVFVSKASFKLKNAKLYDNKNNNEIMKVGELKADKITVDKHNKINIPKLDVSGVSLLKRDNIKPEVEKDTYATTVKLITLSNVNIINLNDYFVESISVNGLQSQLVREKSGQLELVKKIQEYVTSTKQTSKSTAKKVTKAPRLRIGEVHTKDNSRITIVDHAVIPIFREQISNLNLKLSEIDTHETSKGSPIALSFTTGEHGNVVLNGSVALFAKRSTASLKGTIKSLNAANYTGHAFNFIEHHIKRGIMNANLNIKVDKGLHDTEIKLDLHKFYIEEGTESANKKYIKELGVPLPRALSMLREKDDSIKLTLSVKGDTKDPKFSWAYSVNNMIADAIKNSIVNYYTNVSFKITILKAIFKSVKSLSFESVIYKPLEVNLDNTKKELLNDLAKLLNDRPHVELAICGYATQEDRIKLYPDTVNKDISIISDDENGEEYKPSDIKKVTPKLSPQQITRLNELALQRQTILKNYLVQEKGIESKRLIPCNPKYSLTDTGEPRVEFSF